MSSPDTDAVETPPSSPRQELRQETAQLVKLVVLFLVVVVLMRALVIQSTPVQGPSMLPNLAEDDRILVLKLPTLLSRLPVIGNFEAFEAGDLMVFRSPERANKRYVKRVVAVGPSRNVARAEDGAAPNVQVVFDTGKVYVNNRRVEEPYLSPEDRESPDSQTVGLEPGQYYVLGDNRSHSRDSRAFGPVEEGQVIGKALIRYWPPGRFAWL